MVKRSFKWSDSVEYLNDVLLLVVVVVATISLLYLFGALGQCARSQVAV